MIKYLRNLLFSEILNSMEIVHLEDVLEGDVKF